MIRSPQLLSLMILVAAGIVLAGCSSAPVAPSESLERYSFATGATGATWARNAPGPESVVYCDQRSPSRPTCQRAAMSDVRAILARVLGVE